MMKIIKSILLLCLIVNSINSSAQKVTSPTAVSGKIEKYAHIFPAEKLYLSFDKPYYSVGDTLWFKSYLLNADHNVNTRSDRLYIELFNDSCELIERKVIPLNNGLGNGDFILDPKLRDGSYSIRAYTNWQLNFGSDYFFQKNFYIGNAGDKSWLLTTNQKLITQAEKRSLDIKVGLTNIKNEPVGYKDLEIYLMNDQKKIMRTELQTTQNGFFETKIPLPNEKLNGNYHLLIIDKKDKLHKTALPLILKDLAELDLQFMPEGGALVNDIYNKVAFKAIGADGLGKNISGKIINNSKETVAEFTSLHNGMGSFYLLPKNGENYFALFNINGIEKQQKLPISKSEGTTIRIDHLSKPDSLYVFIKASNEKRLIQDYELIAQAADSLLFAVKINLKNGFTNLKLPKAIFPDGLVHFTLFSPEQQPLNERNVFINYTEKISLKIDAKQQTIKPKDSIALEITATDEIGKPLRGSFSIAVTDNHQIKQITQDGNIISHYLLQSNLKGNIEDPEWYFNNQNLNTLTALDNLLLTQGWIGYNWEEILKPQSVPKFIAEKDGKIIGKLTGLFNSPMPNVNLTLLSLGKTVFVTDTVSNSNGDFMFKNLPVIDTSAFTIKIKNVKGKTSSANIYVNEFNPPLPPGFSQKSNPWYINSDSTLLNHLQNGKERIKQSEKSNAILSGIALEEVEIVATNRNITYEVAWDARFYKGISETELKKTPRKKLLDLLREKFEAFKEGNLWYPSCYGKIGYFRFNQYTIGTNLIASIRVDKINTARVAFGAGANAWFETNKQIFEYLNAEDIKSIQIYKGCVFYYLEITTRSGRGPWIGPSKGVYVHKPLPLNFGREFYSPKYTPDQQTTLPDLRSTIYWNANVVTDENGKAKVSFYAADQPSTYTIKLEGTDLSGRFGYQKSTLNITKTIPSK